MRKKAFILTIVICAVTLAAGQGTAATGQTARQALLEMFFSKAPGTLLRHLPSVTRAALEKAGATPALEQYSAFISQAQTQQNNIQTFDSGPVLMAGEDSKAGQKFEVTVESDTLRGDQDELELSFRNYKSGQVQRTPFMPRMTFAMKKEGQVWTLNEVSFTIHLPLADPDLLKALTEKMQPQPQASVVPISHTEMQVQPASNDPMVLSAMHMILTAEATYASRYPATGYACTLSNLDGFGGGEPNERQAMLISSGLASGKKYGVVFTISECGGAPARGFVLTATPNVSTFGRKAFCADQSGTIRSSDDGNTATCLAKGTPVQ